MGKVCRCVLGVWVGIFSGRLERGWAGTGKRLAAWAVVAVWLLAMAPAARGIPAFARRTGLRCSACPSGSLRSSWKMATSTALFSKAGHLM